MQHMLHTVSRRAGLPLLVGSACAATVAIAGCGSGGSASASDTARKATSPGAKLLDQAFSSSGTSSTIGGSASIDIKGSINTPKDHDIQALSGEAKLDVSVQPLEKGKAFPPLSMAFAVRGSENDGDGTPGSGDFRGGLTYVGDQVYAAWQGKAYAAGPELSQKFIDAIQEQSKRQGVNPTDPGSSSAQSKKLITAMDLDPGSWLKSPTVSPGGVLDGDETDKVSGPVDIKAFADDWTHAFRSLATVMPQNPGAAELKKLKDLSDKDLDDAEQAVSVLNASVWVDKNDHALRKLVIDVKFDDKTGDDPSSGDLSIVFTDSKKPTPFEAPKDPAPITDLFGVLQQQFGGPSGPLGGLFGAPKTA